MPLVTLHRVGRATLSLLVFWTLNLGTLHAHELFTRSPIFGRGGCGVAAVRLLRLRCGGDYGNGGVIYASAAVSVSAHGSNRWYGR